LSNELIVDIGAGENRVALLEDGELSEIYIERPDMERMIGNIYRGKVSSVLPGMQAAFIDIGYEKNAFLYVGDVLAGRDYSEDDFENGNDDKSYDEKGNEDNSQDDKAFNGTSSTNGASGSKPCNIADLLKPGQELTVQVTKEPLGSKGPRVTTNITLPGRYLVLLPNADYVGVSRRIENEGERSKLKQIAEELKPIGMGLIIRTASEGNEGQDFVEDLEFLLKLWESIRLGEQSGPVPRCIHRDLGLVYRAVRDLFTKDIDKFIINDKDQYAKVLELVQMLSPSLKRRVKYFSADGDMSEHYQLDARIRKALSRKIWLKCGGYLVIDRTEALTAIDVNTGKYVGARNLEDTVLKTNIEAAGEIAKQLRLRDIGGIIIIDFIDMNEQEHQQMVLDALRQALKRDRTKTTVVGMTGLGLIEMTRKKVKQELSTVLHIACPHCEGTGNMLPSAAVKTEGLEAEA